MIYKCLEIFSQTYDQKLKIFKIKKNYYQAWIISKFMKKFFTTIMNWVFFSDFWQPASCQPSPNIYQHHQNSNNSEKYHCPNCNRVYLRLYCLNRHLRVECNKAPKFKCQICSNWFKYKHNLSAHMKLHVELPKFTCTMCSRKFYRRDKLLSHGKKHHNVDFEKTDGFL